MNKKTSIALALLIGASLQPLAVQAQEEAKKTACYPQKK